MTPADPIDREVLGILGQYADDEEVRRATARYVEARRRLLRMTRPKHRRTPIARAVAMFGAGVAAGYVLVMLALRLAGV